MQSAPRIPANTRTNTGSMFARRLRRRSNIEPSLVQRQVRLRVPHLPAVDNNKNRSSSARQDSDVYKI